MAEAAAPQTSDVPVPTHADLFLAFVRITLSGFGGTLPWTRRMLVEQKRWMTTEEFNEAYALCQFLPGPNIVNLTAVFGSRMRGPTGALACWSGFMLVPFFTMVIAGLLYERFGDVEAARRVLAGIAPAAAGLIVATAAKMAVPVLRQFGPAPFVVLATIVSVGIMRWPLLPVMIALLVSSIGLAWWVRR